MNRFSITLGLVVLLALPSWALEQVVYTSDLTNYVTKAEIELKHPEIPGTGDPNVWMFSENPASYPVEIYTAVFNNNVSELDGPGWLLYITLPGVEPDPYQAYTAYAVGSSDATSLTFNDGITATLGQPAQTGPGYVLGNQTNDVLAAAQDIVLQPVYGVGESVVTWQYTNVPDEWTVQDFIVEPYQSDGEQFILIVSTPEGSQQFASVGPIGTTEIGFFVREDPFTVITAQKVLTPTVGALEGYALPNQTNFVMAAAENIVLQPVYAEISGSGESTFQYSGVPDGWTVQEVTITPYENDPTSETWTLTVLTPSGERQSTANMYVGADNVGFLISEDPLIVINVRKIETPTVGPFIGYTLPNQTNCVLLAQSYVDDNYISKVALHNALTNINTNLQTANDTRNAVSNLITVLKGL